MSLLPAIPIVAREIHSLKSAPLLFLGIDGADGADGEGMAVLDLGAALPTRLLVPAAQEIQAGLEGLGAVGSDVRLGQVSLPAGEAATLTFTSTIRTDETSDDTVVTTQVLAVTTYVLVTGNHTVAVAFWAPKSRAAIEAKGAFAQIARSIEAR